MSGVKRGSKQSLFKQILSRIPSRSECVRYFKNLTTKQTLTFVAAIGIPCLAGFVVLWQQYETKTRPNYSGEWELHLLTEHSTMSRYKGMDFGFKMHLSQTGESITGSGELWSEGGEDIPYKRHSPLKITGSVSGNSIKLNFEMKGLLRDTAGSVNLSPGSEKNALQGTFSWTSADSRGTARAQRLKNSAP